MSFNYNKTSLKNAKILRKNMTEEERKLWYLYLRKEPIKWRRQQPIGNYIADFYCAKARLIIEIDGGQHTDCDAVLYDRKRTEYFQSLGLEVIRFFNFDINRKLDDVCRSIDIKVRERISTPSVGLADSSPERGSQEGRE